MSVAPIKENDYYSPSATKLTQIMNFKGPQYIKFRAPRCDVELAEQVRKETSVIDTTVGLNYVKAWNMRPRDKKKEIGPRFRFNHKIQMERLHYDLHKDVKKQFQGA